MNLKFRYATILAMVVYSRTTSENNHIQKEIAQEIRNISYWFPLNDLKGFFKTPSEYTIEDYCTGLREW